MKYNLQKNLTLLLSQDLELIAHLPITRITLMVSDYNNVFFMIHSMHSYTVCANSKSF